MSEEMIIRLCSPTLAGLKTGSLFNCSYTDQAELFHEIRSINQRIVSKGICLVPLRMGNGRAMLYLYRPRKLQDDLAVSEAAKLLEHYGYPVEQSAACVTRLRQRLRDAAEFPHEIGLFLGYPPADVRGFIENHADRCKCVGCWKVYGDEAGAKKKFEQYRKCTDIYCSQWGKGIGIERLTVAG